MYRFNLINLTNNAQQIRSVIFPDDHVTSFINIEEQMQVNHNNGLNS